MNARREDLHAGFRPSRLTLGCGGFGSAVSAATAAGLVEQALDLGISCFDTADAYADGESERILGRAVAARRAAVTLVSKTGGTRPGGPPRGPLAKGELAAACEGSLRRLGTDRIDLYLLHRLRSDEEPGELLDGFSGLVRQGKILAYGFSNAAPESLLRAAAQAAARPAALVAYQGEFSVAVRAAEKEIAPVCRQEGLAFMGYSPFAGGGLLRDKPPRGRFLEAEPGLLARHRERISEAARRFRVPPAQAALSWVLSRPWVATAVVGASSAEQLRQAAGGARPMPELVGFLDADPIPALAFESREKR